MIKKIPGFDDLIIYIEPDAIENLMNKNVNTGKDVIELVEAINKVEDFYCLESCYSGPTRKGTGCVDFVVMNYSYGLSELFLSAIASRFQSIVICCILYRPLTYEEPDENNELKRYSVVNLIHRIMIDESDKSNPNTYSELVNAVCDFAEEVNN